MKHPFIINFIVEYGTIYTTGNQHTRSVMLLVAKKSKFRFCLHIFIDFNN